MQKRSTDEMFQLNRISELLYRIEAHGSQIFIRRGSVNTALTDLPARVALEVVTGWIRAAMGEKHTQDVIDHPAANDPRWEGN